MSRRITTSALAAATMTFAPVGAAHAATVHPDQAAPSCITRELNDSGFTDHLWVESNCKSTYWAKVILAKHADLSCYEYEPGSGRSWDWNWPGEYDGLQLC